MFSCRRHKTLNQLFYAAINMKPFQTPTILYCASIWIWILKQWSDRGGVSFAVVFFYRRIKLRMVINKQKCLYHVMCRSAICLYVCELVS